MAKLAHQTLVIQVSKAVSDQASEELHVLDVEALSQLLEAAEALAGEGAVVEIANG